MNFVEKIIEKAREDYRKEANKTTIELMYITRTIRKGQVGNGTN